LYKEYAPGDCVYYWYPVKKRTMHKEALYKWQGPYVVVEQLSTTVYRIQAGPRSKSLVVNHDKLKPAAARTEVDTSWVVKLKNRTPQEVLEAPAEVATDSPTGNPASPPLPRRRRQVKGPQRYGEWI
jgi:hypothetical protein